MNIYVGGTNGVGKSTILRRLAQIDKRFEVVHVASALMQELGLRPGDYDGLHAIPNSFRDATMAGIMEGLARRQTKKVRLIDGHYINTVWGVIHTVTEDWGWVGLLDAFVLIEATPEVIWKRISEDAVLRDRELFTRGSSDADKRRQLVEYIHATRQQFDELISAYPKDHFILTHNDNDVDRAARKLANFVDTVRG